MRSGLIVDHRRAGLRLETLLALMSAAAFAQTPPSDFRSNHEAGEALIRQGKLMAAIPYLERAEKADPAHYANAWDLALAYFQTGKVTAARRQLHAMIARRDVAELRNLLAAVEERSGNATEAAKQYETAAHMDPTERHLGDWADHLIRYRVYAPALEVYRRAAEMHPRSSRIRVGLGVAYYATGQYDEAVASLCEAIDLNPADSRPMVFLGKMIDTSPTLAAEVTRRFAGYVKLYPNNPLAHYYYALSLWKEAESQTAPADFKAVEDHLKSAVALDPRSADAWYQLGLVSEKQGRNSDAVRAFEEAVQLQPERAPAHYRLSRAYQRLGQSTLARRELEIFKRLRNRKAVEAEKR